MKRLVFLLLFSIFIAGCFHVDGGPRDIELKTEDGLKIAGVMNGNSTETAIIFLHMLNGKKEDWNELNKWISEKGYTTLAIDFRGHGESDGKADDFSNMILDVKAAKKYLKDKGYENIYIVGGSIGANVGFRYAASDSEIKKVILFSPGENYKGVTVMDVIDDYKGELYTLSSQVLEEEFAFATKMKDRYKGEKKLRVINIDLGHGTKMVEKFSTTVYPDFELFLRR